jgi:hypothetical protein
MPISPASLVEAARYLEQHDESQRIKKLIFCLCKKYWENDVNVLNSQSFESLLLELAQTRPNIEQLTFSMYKLVKTLNRPKVYAAVAKTILDQLGPIYTAQADEELLDLSAGKPAIEVSAVEADGNIDHPTSFNKATQIEAPLPSKQTEFNKATQIEVQPGALAPEVIARQIAQTLEQHSEQARIKKLMFAVSRGAWENNLEVIDNYGFARLILDLRRGFPTRGDLQIGFDQVVNNINKATLYLAIANLILAQMDALYEELEENWEVEESSANTGIVKSSPPPPLARIPRGEHVQTSIIDFSETQRTSDPLLTVLGSIPAPPLPPAFRPISKQYNLFELRQEIMQNTNPLRAKVLLFSILFHSWDDNGQDWGLIRSYGLDDLVEQVLLSRKPPNDIELKLYAQAKEMADREAYTQAAGTLLKVLKPFL